MFYGKNPLPEQGTDWGAVTLTKDNFGNHGSITAKYTTQDVNGEKTAVVTAVAPQITTRSVFPRIILYHRVIFRLRP